MAKNALAKNRRESVPAETRDLRVVHTLASKTATRLDRLIHERIRLGIVSALAANDSLSFNELKKLLKTTDGNLSVHLHRPEEAVYVAVE